MWPERAQHFMTNDIFSLLSSIQHRESFLNIKGVKHSVKAYEDRERVAMNSAIAS